MIAHPRRVGMPARLPLAVAAFVAVLSSCSVQAPAAASDAADPPAPFTDYRHESPGKSRRITPADLPPPHATASARNSAAIVARPADAWPKAPTGFKVEQYATGLPVPRQIRVAPNGDAFVALSYNGKIQVFRGVDADGKAQQSATFAGGLNKPYGIAFYPPEKPQWIYVAGTDSIDRLAYRDGDMQARGKPEHIADLPGGGHWTRDIVFSADAKTLYVAVGSASNVSEPKPDRAGILAFNPDGSGKRVFASGIRNPAGLAIQPGSGAVWCSVNERDELGDNLVPDYITHVQDGGFYGWPWWYIGAHQDPRHAGEHPELRDKVIVPDVLLQPHNGSLGLTFYDGSQFPDQYRGDIFAGEHGSWNKATRAGYEVIRVPLHGSGKAGGEYEDFVTGFVLDDGKVWGRPVGVAVARDGSLLVTDDASGSIWRVSYVGNAKAESAAH
jgi:glucose/arabinose dehydrogenase